MSTDCVVDASVAVKLFVNEPLSERADALFAHLTDSPPARFYVPDLFFVECANVLWKYVRRFGYPVGMAAENLADLLRIPFRVVATEDLVIEALELAIQCGVSVCDAMYEDFQNGVTSEEGAQQAKGSAVRCSEDKQKGLMFPRP